ncbi:MAG: sulfatase-like hydrolase/transferase [Haloarculaceae archaeon]
MSTNPSVSNVVLVTVDSLRADAVGTTAADQQTPEIGRLAESSVVFENAFAHGNWTPFSFPSIFASRSVFSESDDIGLPGTPVLAEVLGDVDIETGGFNAANGFLTGFWGYDRGFDAFDPFIADGDASRYQRYLAAHPTVYAWLQLATSPFRRLAHRFRRGTDSLPFTDTSRLLDVERGATEFLQGADSPFFLWIHYMDTHTPYVPAPRHLREITDDQLSTHRLLRAHLRTGLGRDVGEQTLADLRALYRGAVRQVDASIGRLRGALSEAGIADETALIVAGDHGEEFMEHGNLAHYPKLYDSLIHVPLVVSVPGGEPRHVEEAVGLDAIPPTVCDFLDVEPPATWDGGSLAPAVDGARPDRAPILSVTVRGESVTQQPIPRCLDDGDLLVSARTADWTYIENTATGEPELYHRGRDPDHQHDLAADDEPPQDVVDRLTDAVDRHVSRLGGGTESDESLEDSIATRLDALGYR